MSDVLPNSPAPPGDSDQVHARTETDSIPDPPAPADDIAQVRALIIASHTDIVPEMIRGDTIAELVDSIQPAQQAFVRAVSTVSAPPVSIPAGGNTPLLVDAEVLPTSEKIRRGLAASKRKG